MDFFPSPFFQFPGLFFESKKFDVFFFLFLFVLPMEHIVGGGWVMNGDMGA